MDRSWTIFLDRDGVLNEDHVGGYVLGVEALKLLDGVGAAMRKIAAVFGKVIVCTNQRAIGKGLLSEEELRRMHRQLSEWVAAEGGRIDRFYYATDLDDQAYNRKPNPGMAFQAQTDFPTIDFSRSLMVGNNLSDMQFARNAGMQTTVFLTTTIQALPDPHPLVDARFDSLKEFADTL